LVEEDHHNKQHSEDGYEPLDFDNDLEKSEDDDYRESMPMRKFSSPPASIYEENEDGRMRLSEDNTPNDTFSVSDPVKGAHVTYTVRGYDGDGPFEGAKRYNDFFHLRSALIMRWPGVYVPPIPPRKAIGNKEDKFLEERKHFLQRFLLMIGKDEHLIKSDEFRLFSRVSGEIEKSIQMLPAITPDFLLDRYKTPLKMVEGSDLEVKAEYKNIITDYSAFCKTFMKTLKYMRDSIKDFVPAADKQHSNYKEIISLLSKFEKNVLVEYSNDDNSKQVISEFEEKSNDIPGNLTNPIKEFFYWIKGEIYDLQALND
jgi:sorting nexin-1/2